MSLHPILFREKKAKWKDDPVIKALNRARNPLSRAGYELLARMITQQMCMRFEVLEKIENRSPLEKVG